MAGLAQGQEENEISSSPQCVTGDICRQCGSHPQPSRGNATVGALAVTRRVLCQTNVLEPSLQKCFWAVVCPSHPRKIKTSELFLLVNWSC